jgi:uroporphyrinogen-III synthase
VAVVAYDKRLPPEAPRRAAELFATPPLGWVTFTSPRIVRHFAELFGTDWERRRGELRAASIGPVTSAELRRLGVEPAAEARQPSDEELVAAVARVEGQTGTNTDEHGPTGTAGIFR